MGPAAMSLITFVTVAHGMPDSLRTCLSSLIEQTERDIDVIVVDNTQIMEVAVRNKELCLMDQRIRYEWVADRTNISYQNFRHKHCLYTATEIGVSLATGDWLCFPNQDSYYVPVFADRILSIATRDSLEFVYCNLVLGTPYQHYRPLDCQPCCRAIDKTNFIMKREWFTGFQHKWAHYDIADGLMVDDLVARGIQHGKINEYLVVHN